ncbi:MULTISPECIES: hypothetical protein [unclassified Mesorhizobium]|uniref:hypothetical protein n=1 Tax=unclassified Mesorhizobium TaxID=325217 RepID=UPI003336BF99
MPSAVLIPSGCRFHPPCPLAVDRCRHEKPRAIEVGSRHLSACWFATWPQGMGRGATQQHSVQANRNSIFKHCVGSCDRLRSTHYSLKSSLAIGPIIGRDTNRDG